MLKFENIEVVGLKHAIRGMRNSMNSWKKSDSQQCGTCGDCENCIDFYRCPFDYDCRKFLVGPNDLSLMQKLIKGGPEHSKFRRMIVVYMDITGPLYWWKEFDTYKVGTVANNQKRTVMMNYEVLANICKPGSRRSHKLDEWSIDFMKMVETLPYSKELIFTGEE